MRGVLIPKGKRIVCPLCRTIIGEVIKDLHWGGTITSDSIKLYDKELKSGDEMLCPKCNFPFSVDILVFGKRCAFMHTEDGFIPDFYPFEEVMKGIRVLFKKTGKWRSKWDEMWEKFRIEGE